MLLKKIIVKEHDQTPKNRNIIDDVKKSNEKPQFITKSSLLSTYNSNHYHYSHLNTTKDEILFHIDKKIISKRYNTDGDDNDNNNQSIMDLDNIQNKNKSYTKLSNILTDIEQCDTLASSIYDLRTNTKGKSDNINNIFDLTNKKSNPLNIILKNQTKCMDSSPKKRPTSAINSKYKNSINSKEKCNKSTIQNEQLQSFYDPLIIKKIEISRNYGNFRNIHKIRGNNLIKHDVSTSTSKLAKMPFNIQKTEKHDLGLDLDILQKEIENNDEESSGKRSDINNLSVAQSQIDNKVINFIDEPIFADNKDFTNNDFKLNTDNNLYMEDINGKNIDLILDSKDVPTNDTLENESLSNTLAAISLKRKERDKIRKAKGLKSHRPKSAALNYKWARIFNEQQRKKLSNSINTKELNLKQLIDNMENSSHKCKPCLDNIKIIEDIQNQKLKTEKNSLEAKLAIANTRTRSNPKKNNFFLNKDSQIIENTFFHPNFSSKKLKKQETIIIIDNYDSKKLLQSQNEKIPISPSESKSLDRSPNAQLSLSIPTETYKDLSILSTPNQKFYLTTKFTPSNNTNNNNNNRKSIYTSNIISSSRIEENIKIEDSETNQSHFNDQKECIDSDNNEKMFESMNKNEIDDFNLINNNLNKFEEEKHLIDDIVQKIQIINEKLDDSLKTKLGLVDDIAKEELNCEIDSKKLTRYEIEIIKNEYSKPLNMRNYENLDKLLSRLTFFEKLLKPIRIKILQNAKYVYIKKGNILFNQGDYGDHMYIIIKGCIDICKIHHFPDNVTASNTIASLYDGTHFGELAMMGTKTRDAFESHLKSVTLTSKEEVFGDEFSEEFRKKYKKRQERLNNIASIIAAYRFGNSTRLFTVVDEDGENKATYSRNKAAVERTTRSATAYAAESTDLLALSRENYQEIMLSILQKDIDEKVSLLLEMPFFADKEGHMLIPLANNISSITFKAGQRIIKQGCYVDHFYIVANGRIEVVHEEIEQDPLHIRVFKKKLKPFTFKNLNQQISEATKKRQDLIADILRRESPKKLEYLNNYDSRSFDNEIFINPDCPNTNTFRRHIVINKLKRGDFFGIKSLYITEEDEKKNKKNITLKAKLSVVATSPTVELYVLDRKNLIYVTEAIKNMLLEGLKKYKDFDEIDIDKHKNDHRTWHTFKHRLITGTYNRNEIEKKKKKDDYKVELLFMLYRTKTLYLKKAF